MAAKVQGVPNNNLSNNNVQAPSSPISGRGSELAERARQIHALAKGAQNFVGNAAYNPARTTAALFTTYTGARTLLSGDFFTGTAYSLVGLKELLNQCQSGDTTQLVRILNDINADVGMIKTLEEGQQESHALVEQNLTLIEADVKSLQSALDDIQRLSTHRVFEINEAKTQADNKILEAEKAYVEVVKLFQQCKASFSASKATYQKCAQHFSSITALVNKASNVSATERLSQLVELSLNASNDCSTGQRQLAEADTKLRDAMEKLQSVISLKDEALKLATQTLQKAEDTLVACKEKAQYTLECNDRIKQAKNEMVIVKSRANKIKLLLEEMKYDVKTAKELAAQKLDTMDLLLGVGAGVLSAPLGAASAMTFGVATAYAWHNGADISNTVKKIYRTVKGERTPPAKPMEKNELVRVRMNEVSSGYFGWIMGERSHTIGITEINFGNEVMTLPIDLNQSKYPISKESLLEIFSKMTSKLADQTLEPKRCLQILDQLEAHTIPRPGRETVKGLIKQTGAAYGIFDEIKQLCQQLSPA